LFTDVDEFGLALLWDKDIVSGVRALIELQRGLFVDVWFCVRTVDLQCLRFPLPTRS
jgi:hypothetical protein